MKGKLVKCNHFYALQIDSDIIAVSLDKETEEHTVNYTHQLSLKNCEAIELGYDLDELAKSEAIKISETEVRDEKLERIYKRGFQKALEILGDKKFSEKELTMLFAYGHQIGMNTVLSIQSQHSPQPMDKPDSDKLRDEFIQSLKQTEWDVEVVMDRIPADLAPDGWDVFPKLDAQNCIILKRVE